MEFETYDNSCENFNMIPILAAVLDKLVVTGSFVPNTRTTKFHARCPPDIRIIDYLERIRSYSSCSRECFVLALIYIDRAIKHRNIVLNVLNIHRIIITRFVNCLLSITSQV